MKLFLDDIRQPQKCVSYMRQSLGDLVSLYQEDWFVVKNFEDFKEAILRHYHEITHISFDHDLADITYNPMNQQEHFEYHETTGYDCAKWMKNFYDVNLIPYPIMFVHTQNPIGAENIIKLFN